MAHKPPRVIIIGTYHSIQLFDPWHALDAVINEYSHNPSSHPGPRFPIDVLFDEWPCPQHELMLTAVQTSARLYSMKYHQLESLESLKEIPSKKGLERHDEREKHWIDVIKANHNGQDFLVVCGMAHTFSFGLKLKALEYLVDFEFVASPDLNVLDLCYEKVKPILGQTK